MYLHRVCNAKLIAAVTHHKIQNSMRHFTIDSMELEIYLLEPDYQVLQVCSNHYLAVSIIIDSVFFKDVDHPPYRILYLCRLQKEKPQGNGENEQGIERRV